MQPLHRRAVGVVAMTKLKTLDDFDDDCVSKSQLKEAAIEWLKFFQSQPDPDAFLGERIIIKKFFDITSDDLL